MSLDYLKKAIDFLYKEWLFAISLSIYLFLIIFTFRFPHYSLDEFEVIFILFVMMIIVNGLQKYNLLSFIALQFERGKFIQLKIIIATYLISLLTTNDIALIIMIPLTLLMKIKNKMLLVTIESIVANAAFLPYNTPQNLYIYWHYQLDPIQFIKVIAPLGIFYFFVSALFVVFFDFSSSKIKNKSITIKKKSWHYVFLLFITILSIFKLLPFYILLIVPFYALFLDFSVLKKVDYYLLGVFFLFFGISDNISHMIHVHILDKYVFLYSMGLSQIISNVPSAIVISDLTNHWKPLLWGVNVGGYGVLWGSLASIIAYNFFTRRYFFIKWRFLFIFLFIHILFLLFGVAFYYCCARYVF